MKAVLLAGGMGTRLRSVVSDMPKPMAPVCGRPFLEILLTNMINQGVEDITLSVGYRHEVISNYFGDSFLGIPLHYVVEDTPLGTGGALRMALEGRMKADPFLVFNADTFIHLDLNKTFNAYLKSGADVGMVLKPMQDASRYGRVSLNDSGSLVASYEEKAADTSGLINAGVYLLKPQLFQRFDLPLKFSLEQDVFMKYLSDISIFPFVNDAYFIDIGIPEDYERAQSEMEFYCR